MSKVINLDSINKNLMGSRVFSNIANDSYNWKIKENKKMKVDIIEEKIID